MFELLLVILLQLKEDTACGHHGYHVMRIVVGVFKREAASATTLYPSLEEKIAVF